MADDEKVSLLLSPRRLGAGLFRWLVVGLGFALAYGAQAQVFSADAYYEQCLRFEASGDLDTARQMCLNALALEPRAEAGLALARIELARGDVANAEAQLRQLQGRLQSPELYLLMAEAALRRGRVGEAAGQLAAARRRLGSAPDAALRARLDHLAGAIAQARGDYPAAVRGYRAAIAANGLELRYRLALSELLFRLGQAEEAQRELEAYAQLSGEARDPQLLSLLGRIKWGRGDLGAAARELEAAVALRGSAQAERQARDLQALALIYYGQGDLRAGGLAWQDALGRGALLMELLSRGLVWLLGLIALLGAHLLGEGQVPSGVAPAPAEAPALWSVGEVYGVSALSLALALAAALGYGAVRYDNALALATPLQSGDARAVFALVLALAVSGLSAYRVRRRGWEVGERLLGGTERLPSALLLGALLLALTLLYLRYAPAIGSWLGTRYYLDLLQLRPTVVVAALLVPVAELFFCAFALPPLRKRYQRAHAVTIAGLLFALALASPVPLLALVGWLLAGLFVRSQSGLATVVAKLVLNVGLLLGVAFVPFVRTLFY